MERQPEESIAITTTTTTEQNQQGPSSAPSIPTPIPNQEENNNNRASNDTVLLMNDRGYENSNNDASHDLENYHFGSTSSMMMMDRVQSTPQFHYNHSLEQAVIESQQPIHHPNHQRQHQAWTMPPLGLSTLTHMNHHQETKHPPRKASMDQFFEKKCFIEWKDITFPMNSSHPILKRVCGFAAPGKITAICGPIASGKSTLLRILSNRGSYKNYSGDILLNGQIAMNRYLQIDRKVSNKYKSLVSFVSKDFSPYNMPLTVKEILLFAVRFKLPLHSKNPLWTTREERLALLLNAYGLRSKENASFQTLSSGEKRRLSIAVQNVLFNRVVLLEYPTDGIEFGESFHLLKKMKVLANLGVCIIMCLHRPSILELDLFDYVSILHKGSTIYFGNPNMIQDYFNLIGVQLPFHRQNVLISVLELLKLHELSKSNDENDLQLAHEHLDWSDEKCNEKREHLNVEFEQRMDLFYTPQKLREQAPYLQHKIQDIETEKYYSDYFCSILFLLQRSYLVKFRQWKTDILSPFLEKLIVAVFIGLLYLQIEPTNMTLKGRIFSFLNLNISITFGLALRTLTTQLPLMTQERNSRSYRIGAFYIAKSIEDMADFVLHNLVFGLTIYLMAGMSYLPEHVFAFILIFSMYNLACISCAQALVAIFPVASVLYFIAPVINLIFTVVSGSYSLTSTQFLNWVGYLSFLFYGFRALAINEFRDVIITPPTAPNGTFILPPGHYTNGTLYLERTYGITDPRYMMWVYFGVLCAYFGICKLVGYFGLRYIYRGMSLRVIVRTMIYDWCGCCDCCRWKKKRCLQQA